MPNSDSNYLPVYFTKQMLHDMASEDISKEMKSQFHTNLSLLFGKQILIQSRFQKILK